MMRRSVFLILVCLLAAAAAMAQTVAGMGGLSGVVRDPSGAVIPGASVLVTNEDKGIRRSLTTNEAGVFSAPALVPAAGYKVTVNVQGFSAYEARDIQIQVGQQVDLAVHLTMATGSTQVQVSAEAPIVEDTKTDVSQVVTTEQIQELPINGRRVDSFVQLTPAVVNDGTYGLLSFRGTVGGNTFLTDGNDTTQTYYNENGGRTRISSSISQDAVQEFQVLSAGYTAEYGRAIGGVVNTVTKSGTNSLHGTAYWFFRNQDFNARDRYATINPPESRHQAGASIGGKLIADKLFYFGNFELTRRDFPIASSIERPNVIQNGHFVGCGAPATAAQCAAADALLPRYFGTVARNVEQNLGFLKLDYRPTDRNSFSLSGNYLDWFSPNGIQTAATLNTGAAIGSNGNATQRHRFARASWTSVPSTSAVNEVRFGWFKDRNFDDVNPDLAPPFRLTLSVGGQTNLGIANYLPRMNPSENRYQLADTFTWTKNRHTMKFGFDFANTEDYNFGLNNQFGSYTYGSVSAFAADFTGNTTGTKNYTSYTQALGIPSADFTIRDYAGFAQDQWRVSPKLTINLGVRYDFEQLPQPGVSNPDYPQTARIVEDKKNFAPRVGLAYSLGDKTVIRAGYGMFYGRYSGGLMSTLLTNNGVYTKNITINSPKAGDPSSPVFPNRLDASNLPGGTSSIYFSAPDMRNPYTQHGDLAIERQITNTMGLTVSYIFSRGVQLLTTRDLNIGPLGPLVTYSIKDMSGNTVGTYSTQVYVSQNAVDKRYQRVMQIENGGRSYYDGLAVQLRKRMAHGFGASVSYTWSHAIDTTMGSANDSNSVFFNYTYPNNLYNGDYRQDKGSASNDQRHRLVSTLIWEPRFTKRTDAFSRYALNGWQLSALVYITSAYPTTATVSLVSYPTLAGGLRYVGNTLDGFGGSNRVPFWPTASLDVDQVRRADMRISKMLPFGESKKLYLTFEGFNITNAQDNTSINTTAYNWTGLNLTPASGLGVGRASAGFPDGTNARRLQVGGRFVF